MPPARVPPLRLSQCWIDFNNHYAPIFRLQLKETMLELENLQQFIREHGRDVKLDPELLERELLLQTSIRVTSKFIFIFDRDGELTL